MDYAALETEVITLVQAGDYISAFHRVRDFEIAAAGAERGLCLGLRAGLLRRLSPANDFEALALLEESLAHLGGDPEGRLVTLVEVITLCLELGDPARGLRWAEEFALAARAAATAEVTSTTLWVGKGYHQMGALLRSVGNLEMAAHLFTQAAEVLAQVPDGAAAVSEAEARLHLADVQLRRGRLMEAEWECRVLLRMELSPGQQAAAEIVLSLVALRSGRFGEAERWLEEASAGARREGGEVAVHWMLARSELEQMRGKAGLARGYRRLAQRMAVEGRLDSILHRLGSRSIDGRT